jgi:cytochrome c
MHERPDPHLKTRLAAWLLALGLAGSPSMPADASPQLASDLGCYNCHGNPPRKKAPTFAQLAADYAKARDDERALRRLADKLRDGSIFSHIDAHERLSPEVALQLVRWISEGAP